MKINELTLPKLLLKSIKNGSFYRSQGSWTLKNNQDSFGNHLETELGEVFCSKEKIEKETSELYSGFINDGVYGAQSGWENSPGFIEDITDFSLLLCFGISGDGSPFCLDYRNNPKEPEVIWWDDVYWRKISPNFAEFVKLLDKSA